MHRIITCVSLLILAIGLPGTIGAEEECPSAEWAHGQWQGQITGTGVIVGFYFFPDDEGCLTGTFDKPDEDASGLPLTEVDATDEQVVRVTSDALNFEFEGMYQHERIEGRFIQRGAVFLLDLDPVGEAEN